MTTRNWDNFDAPARSLQHLEVSKKGARDAIASGFAMGIRISKFDLEKSIEDFRATLERTKMAAKWDEATTSAWDRRGGVCAAMCSRRRLLRTLERAEAMEAD